MSVILDTDHLTILQQHDSRESQRLWNRLIVLPADDISTSIVSVQERMQGWLAYLNNAKKATEILFAYAELERLWHFIARMNVLSFTAEAQDRFDRFRKQKTPNSDARPSHWLFGADDRCDRFDQEFARL